MYLFVIKVHTTVHAKIKEDKKASNEKKKSTHVLKINKSQNRIESTE